MPLGDAILCILTQSSGRDLDKLPVEVGDDGITLLCCVHSDEGKGNWGGIKQQGAAIKTTGKSSAVKFSFNDKT